MLPSTLIAAGGVEKVDAVAGHLVSLESTLEFITGVEDVHANAILLVVAVAALIPVSISTYAELVAIPRFLVNA